MCASMAGATFVVVSCLVAGIIISKDINLMYDDFMISMDEFRVSGEVMVLANLTSTNLFRNRFVYQMIQYEVVKNLALKVFVL